MAGRLALVLAGAALVVIATAVASIALARELLACYLDAIPLPAQPICGSGLWGREWVPFGVLAVSLCTLVGCVAGAVWTLHRQFNGAAAYLRRLGTPSSELPAPLVAAVARVCPSTTVQFVPNSAAVGVTAGVTRPRILVTAGLLEMLDHAELDAVLAHEHAHITGRHPFAFGVARAAVSASASVPALRYVADVIVLRAEIEADKAAVRMCGVRPLASALIKLVESPDLAMRGAVGAIGGLLSHRVMALAGEIPKMQPPSKGRTLAIMAGLAVLPSTVALAWLRAKGLL